MSTEAEADLVREVRDLRADIAQLRSLLGEVRIAPPDTGPALLTRAEAMARLKIKSGSVWRRFVKRTGLQRIAGRRLYDRNAVDVANARSMGARTRR